MITKKLRRLLIKTEALVEKNLLIHFRFKYSILVMYIRPLISIFMPLIIFEKLFEFSVNIGPWDSQNYVVFIFTGYNILLLRRMISSVPSQLINEKFWNTLPNLIIAPFNRLYLLIGFMISEFLIVAIPFIIFFIITLILFPISIFNIILIIIIYIGISLVFASLGLVLGVFAISNEGLWNIIGFLINWIFWFSCITYPFEIFPDFFKSIIKLNPIYYIIDLLRLFWISENIFIDLSNYFLHFIIFIFSIIFFPIIGVYVFIYIYKKLESSGY